MFERTNNLHCLQAGRANLCVDTTFFLTQALHNNYILCYLFQILGHFNFTIRWPVYIYKQSLSLRGTNIKLAAKTQKESS